MSSETLGVKSSMQYLGIDVSVLIKSDASAALGIVQRQGQGNLRRTDWYYFYIRHIRPKKLMSFAKLPVAKHLADMSTKAPFGIRYMGT